MKTPSNFFIRGCVLLLLLCLPVFVSASLKFESTTIEHEATTGELAYNAEFHFSNIGQEIVKILDLRTSCGCTVPSLEKSEYASGESGVIRATFTYGSRSGTQKKIITVETSEGPIPLTLLVNIPQKWKLAKRIVRWDPSSQTERQTNTIEFFHGLPCELLSVEINEERFDLQTRWNEDRSHLTLDIGVKEMSPSGVHRIEVVVENANGESMRIPFYINLID